MGAAAATLAFAEENGCRQLQTHYCRFIALDERLAEVMERDGFKRLKENFHGPAIDDLLMETDRALKKAKRALSSISREL